MTPEEFENAARFINARSGFVLARDKTYLLENRLMSLARELKLRSVPELLAAALAGDAVLQTAVIEAMLPKDTAFFRDWKPFVHFRTVVLPNLRVSRGNKQRFRILSAGVSTGQEAHSIAMAIRDVASSFRGWQIDVLGVDLSGAAVAAASTGAYSQFDVQRGLPIRTLLEYFTKQDDTWVINEEIREMVKFQTWNLTDDIFPLGRFDAIFCRNVLVYFDLKAKKEVLSKLSRVLVEDGVLYIGLNDMIAGVTNHFRAVAPDLGIYAAHRADRPQALSLAARVEL